MRPGGTRSVASAAIERVLTLLIVLGLVAASVRDAPALESELGPAKIDVAATAGLRTVLRFDPNTPTEEPTFDLGLDLKSAFGSNVKIVTHTLFRSDGTVADGANEHTIHDFHSVFQDSTPYLEFQEAYLDLELPASALRAGLQKFAWGKLDALNPTDHLNPLDFTRPLDEIESASKIGVPALDLKLLPGQIGSTGPFEEMVLEGVFEPVAVPFRLPQTQDRWYPPLLNLPDTIPVDPGSFAMPVCEGVFPDPTQAQLCEKKVGALKPFPIHPALTLAEIDAPPVEPAHFQWATQWTTTVAGFDIDLSYFDGYDSIPTARLDALVRTSPAVTSGPNTAKIDSDVDVTLHPELDRVRTFGGGFATSVWDLTLKGNFAYVQGRRFNYNINTTDATQLLALLSRAPDAHDKIKTFLHDLFLVGPSQQVELDGVPISVERDAVSGGLQAEYLAGDWILDLGGYLDVMLDPAPGLIQKQFEGRVLVQVRRTFLNDTLTLDLTGVCLTARGEFVGMPKLGYQLLDGLTAEAGVLAIEGPKGGLLGQFRQNDEAFAQITYAWQ